MSYKALIEIDDSKIESMVKNIIKRNYNEIKIVTPYLETKEIDVNQIMKMTVAYEIDILFISMDIMGGGGIEAVSQVKAARPDTHIIIFTKYDSYDVIRQVFVRGADDCVSWQITMDALEISINRVWFKIKKEQKAFSEIESMKQREKTMQSLAKHSLVYSILFKGRQLAVFDDYKKVFKVEDNGYVLNLEISNKEYGVVFDEFTLHKELEKILQDEENALIGPLLFNRVIIIIPVHTGAREQAKEKAKILSGRLIKKLKEDMDLNVDVGVGSVHKTEHIHISYEESIKALRFEGVKRISSYYEIGADGKGDKNEFIIEHVRRLEESIRTENTDIMSIFGAILQLLDGLNEETKKNKVLEIIIYCIHCVEDMGPSECDYVNMMAMAEELGKLGKKEIDAWAVNRMQYVIKVMREGRKNRISEPVRYAKQYISANYAQEISLADMAQQIGVSSQYFSKLFKEETGHNFVEWINTTRISKAKEIIDTTHMTIKEAGYAVGFNDPNYFSRAFKKYTGMTPSQYVQKYKKGNQQ